MAKNNSKIDTVKKLLEKAYSGRTNNLSRSLEIAQEALQISRSLYHNSLIGQSLNQLSLYYMIRSEFVKSKDFAIEAIACLSLVNDERGIANSNYTIGSIHYKTNNYHLGLKYLLESQKIYIKYNDLYNQCKVGKALGVIYEFIGDSDNAFKSYKKSIQIAKKINELDLESNVCNNLSGLLLKKGKMKFAMKIIEYSIQIKIETKDVRGYGFGVYGRGKVYFVAKEYEKAEADFLESIAIHKELIENIGVAMGLFKLGKLYLKLERFNEAKSCVQKCLDLSIQYIMFRIKIKSYYLLYLIYKQESNTPKALEFLEFYLSEKEAVLNKETVNIIENYDLINKMNRFESDTQLQKIKQKSIDKKNRAEQDSVKLKQQFLSIMSHEIRTPLNAITTIVSILQERMTGENKELLQSLQFASDNLINIVNDILDFTKLESKKSKLALVHSDFYKLNVEIFNLHQKVASVKGLELILENNVIENQNYLIDETKLTQILSNLINNAIKFTENGTVIFCVKLIKVKKNHDVIRLSVKDTGEGISERDLAEIFKSFSQAKPIMTRKQGGTGLGLAIVKRLVKLHNSKIKVKSKKYLGSEFYFEIKLKRINSPKLKKKSNFYKLNNKRVLLAEDTPINAMLIKKLLSNWGVITDHVVNGSEAFEYAKNKKYDFILMDIHMPEMNGIDATNLIKTKKNCNNQTPVFAITADVTANKNDERFSVFDDVLWKPIEIDKLYATLATAVKKTRL